MSKSVHKMDSVEWHREFAERYIAKALDTRPRHDVISELGAYIADWMILKKKITDCFERKGGS